METPLPRPSIRGRNRPKVLAMRVVETKYRTDWPPTLPVALTEPMP